MRYFFVLITSMFIFANAYGSISFSAPTDSIGIKIINNRTYILHKVNPGDNLTAVAKRYGVTVNEIKNANRSIGDNLTVGIIILVPLVKKTYVEMAMDEAGLVKRLYTVKAGDYIYKIARDFNMDAKRLKELNQLESEVLNEGQQLIVEVPATALQTEETTVEEAFNYSTSQSNTAPVVNTENANASMNPAEALTRVPKVHKVLEGEYLFSLGRNFNVNLDSVRVWNYMEPADNISLGQDVIVGYNYFDSKGSLVLSTGADIPDVNGAKGSNIQAGKSELGNQGTSSLNSLTPEVKLGNIPKNTKEQGIGMKISGNNASANQIVGLHKTAPYGTYIKVTNPSNGRSTAVKIIGKLPTSVTQNNQLVIMLSTAACQRIGVLNNQFPVVLEYNR
ncbi:MAG: LysM peptidoglycan-binding domain-containing protein [Bacteroidota bacterium]